ncbi:hypothetical protein ACWFRN_05940, partial [Streptomyces celluloflavus]
MIGMFRRFRRLLTRRHVAGPAWWSVVSRLPVYLMSLATVLVVREQGGSYAQAGLVSALYTVGMALGSPFLARGAPPAERGGRRRAPPRAPPDRYAARARNYRSIFDPAT